MNLKKDDLGTIKDALQYGIMYSKSERETAKMSLLLVEVESERLKKEYLGVDDIDGNRMYHGDKYKNLDNGCIGTLTMEKTVGGYVVYCLEYKDNKEIPYNLRPFYELDTTNFKKIPENEF